MLPKFLEPERDLKRRSMMKTNLLGVSALALALTLSACGASEETTNSVAAENGMNTAMADTGPFASVETQMNDAMKNAVGVDASDTWVRKMIEHHRGAVAMSNVARPLAQDPNVRQMAQMAIDKQTKEIAALEKMVATGTPDAASTQLYQAGEMQMHQAMMAAKGATVDETWMRKMIEHHRGAVAMSDVVLGQNPPAPVRAMAQKTKADQTKEIAHLEAMLSGENPMAATPAPAPKTADASPTVAPVQKADPAPAPKATPKAAPKASPKAAPTAEPKQPAPTPTCLPEHRAMGHC
jgi:uncharacterized protein (DUF305 family)